MAFDSVPQLMQSFEAQIINNFVEKLRIFVLPQKFEMQMQLSLAIHEEQQRMDYWREAHGLPQYPSTRGTLAATPPMPLPFIDHHISTLDNDLATSFGESETAFDSASHSYWTSGSSSSSPFRQANTHGMMEGTVSPRELISHDNRHPMVHPASCHDDMSMFTFSDSDNSLPSLPEPPMLSSHRRKTGQRFGTSSRSSQSRHPLPSSSDSTAPRAHAEAFDSYVPLIGNGFSHQQQQQQQQQQHHSIGVQEGRVQTQLDFIPQSNVAGPSAHKTQSLRASRRRGAPSLEAHAFGGGPLGTASSPARTAMSTFPPGQDVPGFVPIGRMGIANAAQGNRWPIERELFEQLVGAERGHGEHRPKTKLTYKEILAKYSRWDIKESTLRGIKRKITLPKEHRERKPRWDAEHIDSLFTHVPVYTDKKGKTSWTKVVDAIKRDTGRPFGAGTTSKKWTDLIKTRANQSSALAQHAHDGEEGCEAEENESSPSCFEAVDNNSEEDLPSHKFFFQEADDEDDKASEFAAVKLQCPQVWH